MTTLVTDNFDSDTGWTDYWSSGWSVDVGVGNTLLGATSKTGVYAVRVKTSTSMGSVDQWAKVELDQWGSGIRPGLILRHSNTANSECYGFYIQINTDDIIIKRIYGTGGASNETVAIAFGSGIGTVTTGSFVGFAVSGTGASTKFEIWKDPVGAEPSDWGTGANYWTQTDTDTSNYVDTGNYTGVFQQVATSTTQWDAFTAGSIAAAGTSIPVFMNHYSRMMRG